jgi:hypothetical protein
VQWHDGRPFTADDVVFNWECRVSRAPRELSAARNCTRDEGGPFEFGALAWPPKTLADRGGNGAQLRYIEAFNISRHLIYRAIYILTQLAAPGVRRGINPPARPGDYRRGHQISRGRQRRIPENSAARLPEWNFQDMLENRLPG